MSKVNGIPFVPNKRSNYKKKQEQLNTNFFRIVPMYLDEKFFVWNFKMKLENSIFMKLNKVFQKLVK